MDGARLDTRRFVDGFLEARVPEPAISHKDVGTVDELDEPDKAVNTETAISHKNVGTGKHTLFPIVSTLGRRRRKVLTMHRRIEKIGTAIKAISHNIYRKQLSVSFAEEKIMVNMHIILVYRKA